MYKKIIIGLGCVCVLVGLGVLRHYSHSWERGHVDKSVATNTVEVCQPSLSTNLTVKRPVQDGYDCADIVEQLTHAVSSSSEKDVRKTLLEIDKSGHRGKFPQGILQKYEAATLNLEELVARRIEGRMNAEDWNGVIQSASDYRNDSLVSHHQKSRIAKMLERASANKSIVEQLAQAVSGSSEKYVRDILSSMDVHRRQGKFSRGMLQQWETAVSNLEVMVVRRIDERMKAGDWTTVLQSVYDYRVDPFISHYQEVRVLEMGKLASENKMLSLCKDMLRSGSNNEVTNVQWRAALDMWQKGHVTSSKEEIPWKWDDQMRGDNSAKKYRDKWKDLFDEQCQHWTRIQKERAKHLVDIGRRSTITNEYCKHVESQLAHVVTAISNQYVRIEIEDWEPNWRPSSSGDSRITERLLSKWRWKVRKSLIRSDQYEKQRVRLEKLVRLTHEQMSQLEQQKREVQREAVTAKRCLEIAKNRIAYLKSADEELLRRLREGHLDDELMDDLTRLIVGIVRKVYGEGR